MVVRICLPVLLLVCATSAAIAQSCTETAGAKQAAELVRHCLTASPATRPPCNAVNPCTMMIDEIKRGCGQLRDKPAFCRRY